MASERDEKRRTTPASAKSRSVRSMAERYERHSQLQHWQTLEEVMSSPEPARVRLAQFMQSGVFKSFMTVCVFASIGIVIFETDSKAAKQPIPDWMEICLQVLLGVYAVECGLRLYVSGRKFFISTLNNIDLALVVAEILAMGTERFFRQELPNVMVMRFFRLIRVARLSSVLMRFRTLYLILQGFFSAMQAIFFATILIFIVLSLWSILAVEFLHPVAENLAAQGAFANCERCHEAYSTVMQSNLTFLQTMIVGDAWDRFVMPVVETEWRSLFIFGGVFITIQVGMLNLILSVIVDSAAQARSEDELRVIHEKMSDFEHAKRRFGRLCGELDLTGNGTLTEEELFIGLETHPELAKVLTAMDITEDELGVLYKMMDVDRSGDVSYTEFTEVLHRFKNDDLRTQIMFLKHYVLEITNKLDTELCKDLKRTETRRTEFRQTMRETMMSPITAHEEAQACSDVFGAIKSHGTDRSPADSRDEDPCDCQSGATVIIQDKTLFKALRTDWSAQMRERSEASEPAPVSKPMSAMLESREDSLSKDPDFMLEPPEDHPSEYHMLRARADKILRDAVTESRDGNSSKNVMFQSRADNPSKSTCRASGTLSSHPASSSTEDPLVCRAVIREHSNCSEFSSAAEHRSPSSHVCTAGNDCNFSNFRSI